MKLIGDSTGNKPDRDGGSGRGNITSSGEASSRGNCNRSTGSRSSSRFDNSSTEVDQRDCCGSAETRWREGRGIERECARNRLVKRARALSGTRSRQKR